jgi:hypothetical protein
MTMKKTSTIRPEKYASGGHGPNKHMFGTGDRTKTDPRDAANTQAGGQVGHSTAKQFRQPPELDNEAGDCGGTGGESRPRLPAVRWR